MSIILHMLVALIPKDVLALDADNPTTYIHPYFRSNRILERIGAKSRTITIRRAVTAFCDDASIVVRYLTFSVFLNNNKWSPDNIYHDKIDRTDYEFVYDPSDPSFDLECIAQTIINWITYKSDLHLVDKMVDLVNESILCPIHTRKPMSLS